ncbi:unnamed protein product, partial [Ranitomeya imitator]
HPGVCPTGLQDLSCSYLNKTLCSRDSDCLPEQKCCLSHGNILQCTAVKNETALDSRSAAPHCAFGNARTPFPMSRRSNAQWWPPLSNVNHLTLQLNVMMRTENACPDRSAAMSAAEWLVRTCKVPVPCRTGNRRCVNAFSSQIKIKTSLQSRVTCNKSVLCDPVHCHK